MWACRLKGSLARMVPKRGKGLWRREIRCFMGLVRGSGG